MTMSEPGQSMIAVVTGANSGVGFGLCHRLLLHVIRREFIALLDTEDWDTNGEFKVPLSLVLACRNEGRGETARKKLRDIVLAELSRLGVDTGSRPFPRGLSIQVELLDLSSVESVFQFCGEIRKRYGHITHLFLNAGAGDFLGMDSGLFFRQIWQEGFLAAITLSKYKIQRAGAVTDDGFGQIWQTNVFGHFMMVRLLTPLLSANPDKDSRIIWTSSYDALVGEYASDDWQLIHSLAPYEASKLQQDLISIQLDRVFAENETTRHIRSFVFDPGSVAESNIFAYDWVMEKIVKMIFYLARWAGSPFHVVTRYKGAAAGAQLAFAPVAELPRVGEPIKYGSRVNRWGTERAVAENISRREQDEGWGERLVERCDVLFNALDKRFSGEQIEDAGDLGG